MSRVQLVNWKAQESPERVARLRAAGYKVRHEVPAGMDFLSRLKTDPPGGLVDYKIRAVEATWSGLLFTRRKLSRR